jgi:hypothetical protein
MYQIFRRTVLTASLVLAVTNLMLGQAQQQTQLSPKAKLETVEYKSADYIAIGYIDKKLFVEGQNVTILSKQTKDTIISGKYFMQAEKAYIDGIWKRNSDNGITRAYGLFGVSNSDSEIGLTTNGKKAGLLNVETKDISKYQGFRNQFPATLQKLPNKNYSLKVDYTGRNEPYEVVRLEITVNNSLIDKYGFFAIDDFVFYTTDVVITQKNGNAFIGKVEYTKDENNQTSFKYKEGKWKSVDGEEEELSLLLNKDYKYHRVYSGKTENNNIKEVELIVTPSQMEKFGFWATTDYFDNISQVKYTYKNGNVFIGEVNLEKKLLSNGTYQYSTGEVFEGNFGGNWFCGIPIEGKMKLKDGTIEEGNWLKKYKITQSEAIELEKVNSPTEIRKKAIDFFNERSYQNAIKEAKAAMAGKNYDIAKEWYLEAKKFIVDEIVPKNEGNDFQNFLRKSNNPTKTEFVDDEIGKIDKIIEDQKWKKDMIAQYGESFGMAIYDGEFKVGMTKKMANEIMAQEVFSINELTHIESWSFNQDNLMTKIAEFQRRGEGICNKFGESSEECRLAAQQMLHMAKTMQRYADRIQQFGGPKMPRRLTFTNGKLSDIFR